MFFDFGWSELMLISVVALVVIGPKDLPRAMRAVGFWMRKARSLSQEFQGHVDDLMRESELEEVHQDLKKATEIDLQGELERSIDPEGSLREGLAFPELEAPSQTTLEEPAPAALEEPSHAALEEASQKAPQNPTATAEDLLPPPPAESAPRENAAATDAAKPPLPGEGAAAAPRS